MIERVPHDRCAPCHCRYTSARRGGSPPCDVRVRLSGSRPSSTLALLTLAAPMLPPAEAQAPGTLVLGLDQEPPDPRPARLAVRGDLPDHRLGDREPRLQGPRRQARPLAGRVVDAVQGRAQRHLQAPARREVSRRHAVQRRRGEVQLRPHRRSQVQGRRRPRRARRLRRLEGARRVLRAGELRDAVRAVPHLRGLRPAQHRVAQGGARDRRPGPHQADRHRAVHDQGVRRQGPHHDGPHAGLQAEAAVERAQPAPPSSRRWSGSSSPRRARA